MILGDTAPLQLSEEVFRVHSARLGEALLTAALYLDARNLKSACNLNNRPTGSSEGQLGKSLTKNENPDSIKHIAGSIPAPASRSRSDFVDNGLLLYTPVRSIRSLPRAHPNGLRLCRSPPAGSIPAPLNSFPESRRVLI